MVFFQFYKDTLEENNDETEKSSEKEKSPSPTEEIEKKETSEDVEMKEPSEDGGKTCWKQTIHLLILQ